MKKVLMSTVILSMLCGCSAAEATDSKEADNVIVGTVSEDSTAQYACRVVDYYDYSTPVAESELIDDEYLHDTIFGGDSRMGSLYLFSDLLERGADIHYTTSVSIWRVYDMGADDDPEKSIYEFFMDSDRHNYYMLFGINEIRRDEFETWKEEYQNIIGEILAKDPAANIYLIQSYHPVELSGITDEALAANIEDQNTKIAELAQSNHVYYLNPDEWVDDDTGKVAENLTWDGLHFNYEGSELFAEFIRTHVVREDQYVKEICE